MARKGEIHNPTFRVAAKLVRYLMDGHHIDLEQGTFYLGSNERTCIVNGMDVADFTPGEFIALAACLEGVEYARVMNYRPVGAQ